MYLIVGSECSVEAVTMTTITCITGPQNLTGPEYPGECSIKKLFNKIFVESPLDVRRHSCSNKKFGIEIHLIEDIRIFLIQEYFQ